MFCTSCGTVSSPDASFCGRCGKPILPEVVKGPEGDAAAKLRILKGGSQLEKADPQRGHAGPEKAEVVSTSSITPSVKDEVADPKIKLWNPQIASALSLLFSPAFGAFLHAKNWTAMGEAAKARSAIRYFYFTVVAELVLAPLRGFDKIPPQVTIAFAILNISIWYQGFGRKHEMAVADRFGKNYEHKGWTRPLLAVLGIFLVFVLIAIGLVATVSPGGSEPPTTSEAAPASAPSLAQPADEATPDPTLGSESTPEAGASTPVTPDAETVNAQPEVPNLNADVPKFADYPPAHVFDGQRAPIDFKTADDRQYRTRLNAASEEPPNFAGEYHLTQWGCGADCITGAVVNLSTGRVIFLPFTEAGWHGDGAPLQYNAGSRLLVVGGVLSEQGPYGAHFFELTDNTFSLVKSVPIVEAP